MAPSATSSERSPQSPLSAWWSHAWARRPATMLFVGALAIRLLNWWFSAGRDQPFAAVYQGDAPYWQQAARVAAGAAAPGLESILPFRPPAMAWLAALLWDGDPATAWRLRLVFAVLGAAVAPLAYRALHGAAAPRTVAIAAWTCALSSSLLALGSGLHGELPYLLLFLLGAPAFRRACRGAAPLDLVAWSGLQGLACLLRADHLLFWLLSMLWLWFRRGRAAVRDLALATATLAAVLLPWQMHAAAAIADYNQNGVAGSAVDAPPPGSLAWDADAIAAVRAMPAFARGATFGFVDATVRTRGGTRVRLADLEVLDEAYGARPEPLATPLLALYGPLNFFLANSPESDGGFTRTPLDRRPPLSGGLDRYPPGLLAALPRDGALEFSYPPHLHAVEHGYRLGLAWIAAEPTAAARLAIDKLAQAWRGAATGIGTLSLPMGRSGVREPVDLTVAEGWPASLWRLALLALAIAGAWRLRGATDVAGHAIWLLAKVATIVLFFGYARLGALCVPTLALYWGSAIDGWLAHGISRWHRRLGWSLAIGLIVAELGAAATVHAPTVNGVPFHGASPMLHGRVRIDY